MDIMDAVRTGLKELILPELDKIKEENSQIKVAIELTNKRLDDINLHLVDQSRRIDETNKRIDEINKRIDETNKRIDETNKRIDETNKRIDETNKRIEQVKTELIAMIDKVRTIFDSRMDQLFLVVVRREDHNKLESRLTHLEEEVQKIKVKLAA
ncbi:MAG: hypothetical protein AB1847_15190 [bacterium]